MEDATTVAYRIKTLIEALGLTDSQFADKCSISRPTLSLLLSGKNKKISDILLSQIHEAFPDVSILWILFGEGSMMKGAQDDNNKREISSENSLFQDESKENDEQLNLVNLKQLENIIQDVVNKSFTTSFSTFENLFVKSSEKTIPRKVNKITVYYDDSTFEIFTPEK